MWNVLAENVFFEIATVIASVLAVLALIGFLSSVHSIVDFEGPLFLKSAVTSRAIIGGTIR